MKHGIGSVWLWKMFVALGAKRLSATADMVNGAFERNGTLYLKQLRG